MSYTAARCRFCGMRFEVPYYPWFDPMEGAAREVSMHEFRVHRHRLPSHVRTWKEWRQLSFTERQKEDLVRG